MAQPMAKTSPAETLLLALAPVVDSGFTTEARSLARARLRETGLPTRRDEYWKFTRPDSYNAVSPKGAEVFRSTDEAMLFEDMDRLKLVFVDGVFDADRSDDLSGEGMSIERLAEAQTADIHWAKDLYGALETRGQTPVARPFAALNTAVASDGVVIRVTGKPSKPVSLVFLHRSETSDAYLHHVIRVEQGAALTLLENGPAAARFNTVMEIDIADGGAFHHIRAQGRDHKRQAITHMFARLGNRSIFKSFTMTMNGIMTRNEAVIELTGDDAVAHVSGACVGDGDFHHDDTVFVTHDAVNCESRQVFKKVLCNGATGVFQGKILVKAGAQKTDGYQISKSLLLDDDCQFLAKPELEIYADDVACSHGSTTGAIDETALFYLRSRGIPMREAQDLLVLSFLAEAIDEVDDPDISGQLLNRLENWLGRRHT